MLDGDNLDWEFWEPIQLFEEKVNQPQYASIREGDNFQRHGYAERAQPIYQQECKRCDKTVLEACAAIHEAESHRAQGKWNEAIKDYRRAFECFHSNDQVHNIAVTHLMLGLCYQAVAQYREALEQFTQAHTQLDLLLKKHREQGNRRNVGKYSALCEEVLLLHWQTRALAKAAESGIKREENEQIIASFGFVLNIPIADELEFKVGEDGNVPTIERSDPQAYLWQEVEAWRNAILHSLRDGPLSQYGNYVHPRVQIGQGNLDVDVNVCLVAGMSVHGFLSRYKNIYESIELFQWHVERKLKEVTEDFLGQASRPIGQVKSIVVKPKGSYVVVELPIKESSSQVSVRESAVIERDRAWEEQGFLEIPILQTEVAAGKPKAVEGDLEIGQIRVGSVILVGGEQYRPVSLTDGSTYMNLNPDFKHTAVRVKGISMDRAKPVGINSGEWVILRRPKEGSYVPRNSHIVSAVLPDAANRTAILKRFYHVGLGVKLESETSEPDWPEHQPREYTLSWTEDVPPVQFVGQAIAVLKHVPKVSQ